MRFQEETVGRKEQEKWFLILRRSLIQRAWEKRKVAKDRVEESERNGQILNVSRRLEKQAQGQHLLLTNSNSCRFK